MKENKKIYVYHGSYTSVKNPEISKCKKGKDFGQGFYVSFDKKQAIDFAKIVARRYKTKIGFLNIYRLEDVSSLKTFVFEKTDITWLNCIIGNRNSSFKRLSKPYKKYDIIIGKIADDDTSQVINAYMSGAYGIPGTKEAGSMAVRMFKTNKLKDQMCFKNKKSLNYLKFISTEEVKL